MEEDPKTLHREVEAHVKALETLKDDVTGVKETLQDSLQQIMQVVIWVHGRVMEQANRFCPAAKIPVEELNPSQGVKYGDLGIRQAAYDCSFLRFWP